jgi:hypothetical protein
MPATLLSSTGAGVGAGAYGSLPPSASPMAACNFGCLGKLAQSMHLACRWLQRPQVAQHSCGRQMDSQGMWPASTTALCQAFALRSLQLAGSGWQRARCASQGPAAPACVAASLACPLHCRCLCCACPLPAADLRPQPVQDSGQLDKFQQPGGTEPSLAGAPPAAACVASHRLHLETAQGELRLPRLKTCPPLPLSPL